MFNLLRYPRLLGLLLLFSALSTFSACSYTNAAKDNPPTPCELPATVSYVTDIQPIFQANCVRCHNSSYTGANAGFIMSDFAQVQRWATTKKGSTGITWMVGNVEQLSGFVAMPNDGGKLSACDIAKIKAWADSGAPQN